ncbi:hypothetical protein NBRGN_015_01010 [Nocardia brasiliensis NBRC 14402]|nr:hypothetical protein NBRGN_015_01010 [Nocardia brasiliensis NBRC 14402]SUB55560.1 Uncharacterised protein [Nocardia brasiliensis]
MPVAAMTLMTAPRHLRNRDAATAVAPPDPLFWLTRLPQLNRCPALARGPPNVADPARLSLDAWAAQ